MNKTVQVSWRDTNLYRRNTIANPFHNTPNFLSSTHPLKNPNKKIKIILKFKKAQESSKTQHTSKTQQGKREYLYRRRNISLELEYVRRAKVVLQPLQHKQCICTNLLKCLSSVFQCVLNTSDWRKTLPEIVATFLKVIGHCYQKENLPTTVETSCETGINLINEQKQQWMQVEVFTTKRIKKISMQMYRSFSHFT